MRSWAAHRTRVTAEVLAQTYARKVPKAMWRGSMHGAGLRQVRCDGGGGGGGGGGVGGGGRRRRRRLNFFYWLLLKVLVIVRTYT